MAECVHDSSSWTQLNVPTKAILFDYPHSVQTVGFGRLHLSDSLNNTIEFRLSGTRPV
jgi:hypothetical protein